MGAARAEKVKKESPRKADLMMEAEEKDAKETKDFEMMSSTQGRRIKRVEESLPEIGYKSRQNDKAKASPDAERTCGQKERQTSMGLDDEEANV